VKWVGFAGVAVWFPGDVIASESVGLFLDPLTRAGAVTTASRHCVDQLGMTADSSCARPSVSNRLVLSPPPVYILPRRTEMLR